MKKILLFLFEGAELLEISAFTDVFGWDSIVGSKDIILETVSYEKSIKCSWGGELKVDKVISEENLKEFFNYNALVIPGGFGKFNFFRDKENIFFKELVKNFVEKDKYIVAVCSAVINLLSTNYIENKKLTTYLLDNKRYFNQLKKYNVKAVEKEICEDGKLLTCSGAGNAIELAFRLLEIFTSQGNKNKVAENMFFKLENS